MKRRLSASLLALALALSLSVFAAAEGSVSVFVPVRTYDGRFLDVPQSSWYYENISFLYELGLAEGQSASSFGPEENITIAEAVGFAARLRSLYDYGDAEAGPASYSGDGGQWHTPYVLYLQALGILDSTFDGLYDTYATRAQMAHIAANALPSSYFSELNATAVTVGYATRTFIRDVDDYTPYQQEILQLYRWGILSGSDAAGSFHPDDYITRGEFAALLTRLAEPSLRLTLRWDVSSVYSARDTTYEDLAQPGVYRPAHSLTDQSAIDSNIRYMLHRGENTLTLQMDPSQITTAAMEQLMGAYLDTIRLYIEQGYNAVQCTYSISSGQVTLSFYSSIFTSESLFASARADTLAAAIQVHDTLWQNGVITGDMTDYEKALAYFTWICENCSYDYRATASSVSHTAYSLFQMGSAVCDGYTAAYNLLLKLEGIDCTTASTEDHIWTVAQLDGSTYHIDTTWGDQTGTIRYDYFGMTEAESLARFQL